MIDKTKLTAPLKLHHKFLGCVAYTESCAEMERRTGNETCDGAFGSLYVEHEGDIKEVSLALLTVKE